MRELRETTFGNVVLGAYIQLNGVGGQKIDEPISENKNKHGQDLMLRGIREGIQGI